MIGVGDNLAGSLWYQTMGYGARAPKLAYLTDEQNCRLERMRIARMLWKGNHRQAYLTERRSQFDFPELEIQGRIWWPYITLNVLKLISTTMADLLLGEDPAITIADEIGQAAVDDLRARFDIDRVFYEAVKTASWASETMVEIIRWDGEVYIQDAPISEIFPIGRRQPDGQYPSYVRYATEMSLEAVPRKLLLESTYTPGLIARQCFVLSDAGQKLADKVKLDLWPIKNPNGSPLADREATGIAWNTLIWMANELDEGCPTSDYDGLIELQDELNAKQTQIARVIAMHADPAIAFPQSAVEPDGTIRVKKKAFFFRSKDEIPQYIVWNAELAAAMEDRDVTLNMLCIASELSQGLLGLEKGGAPDSARKLRLQATKSLARVKRKSKFVRPFIRTAVETALMMERAGRVVKVAMGLPAGSAVDLRDGLPVDELDQANTIAILTGNKPVMSVDRAVHTLITDPEAADKELAELGDEAAAAAPSVRVTAPGETPNGKAVPAPAAAGESADEYAMAGAGGAT